jgi:urea carboxylase
MTGVLENAIGDRLEVSDADCLKQQASTRVAHVLSAGIQTTVQDQVGRTGMWGVGVPPSGAWDELSFALANRAVGNGPQDAGLEMVVVGPTLRFTERTLICVAGAVHDATVDGRPVRPGVVTVVPAGGTLECGSLPGPGMRGYLAVRGGVAVPRVLGSRATFLLGGFGGLDGRALIAGDVLPIGRDENAAAPLDLTALLPEIGHDWQLRVIAGPHGSPEHLTEAGEQALYDRVWEVDHRADRTGIRLTGRRPDWSRVDGGEAGLHPSNIHDSAYPVGGIMLSGDTPVIVGPDGPSLGGFVVPCATIRVDRWMLGQFRPGDRVRLVPVSLAAADAAFQERVAGLADPASWLEELASSAPALAAVTAGSWRPDALLAEDATEDRPAVLIRAAGDHHLLVEMGPPALDLAVRLRIRLLADALRAAEVAGITETVEGVRSLLVAVDQGRLPLPELAATIGALAAGLPDPSTVRLEVREVTLPLALDDPTVHEAMQRYQRSVRPDAPWCPDNVEFIRRINDLPERSDVFDIVLDATYLVVGLGDVYLGAPVAVPIDPRHRLVTTKYDPARTWTPENAVGIGGVYLCVYGMEGPGGYQLVGRTVPVWRLANQREVDGGTDQPPWLLRPFDLLRFRPVTSAELTDLRADVRSGRRELETRPATFALSDVLDLEQQHAEEIAVLRRKRRDAFDAERDRWATKRGSA